MDKDVVYTHIQSGTRLSLRKNEVTPLAATWKDKY